MKSIKRFGALFGFILIASFPAVQAAPPSSDDFNDNVKSPAWGDDIIMSGSAVFLTETNAHLEFTGSTIGDSTILRPWVAGMGSYTQNWEAAVDLNVGNISLSAEGDGISMMLAVADSADETFGDRMVISIDLDRGWESVEREFYLSSAVAGIESTTFPNSAEVFTANTNGRMRIAFDSFTKTLYASYNGIPIGSMDLDDAATSWNMTAGSTFAVVLGGSMWNNDANGYTTSSHEVYADNFILRTGSNLPYDLAVKNGSGSGAYTNGAKVAITASNAPSGQVFDHWAGSVQYVASVTSAATTVTMPAQAITLTATYKLTGAIASDDFNDNVKDTAKWGDDMVVNGTDAVLQETNGRLEFSKSSTDSSTVIRPWMYSTGSYTQNWEVSMDAYLGDIVLPPMSGEYVNINLAVVNQQSTNLYNGMFPGDAINIALDLYRDWDGYLIRGYELTSRANAVELSSAPNYGYTSTADVQGRLKIAFDAITKVLTASYNGNVLGWVDVNASGSNWAMTDSGSFGVAIAGGSGMITVSSGEVYVDNFAMTGAGIPPAAAYTLTVNNGSGSGAYTNNSRVEITASEPAVGKVFEHWAGATQYVANVTSATTTVTMPAQAITLTAAYKLAGVTVGDDFNDDFKNTAKWGEDIHFVNTNTSLLEINGRLEFVKEAGIDGYGVLRPWVYTVGSYTQSWEVSMDAFLGDIALPENAWINLNLAVANRQDTNIVNGIPMGGDALDIALDLYADGGSTYRGYEMTSRLNAVDLTNAPNYGYISTSDLQGRLKITFDAPNKVLTAFYNGNVLGWVDIDDPASNWEMPDGATFGIVIVGSTGSGALGVASGEVYADNFTATGTVIPPVDGDGNGLPDWWEQQYFSGTGVAPSAICSNGVNTVLEAYIAGLNPNDPSARFVITGGDAATGMIQWNAVSGRVYNVYWTTNLLNGFHLLQTNYTGGSITDSTHSAAGKCFYKIDVRMAQ